MKKLFLLVAILGFSSVTMAQEAVLNENKWSVEKAKKWYDSHQWITGANFVPSTAINQLEMWQEETFDPETIDRELGWAEDLGFNTIRVYLHDLLWEQDSTGFLDRMDQFLRSEERRVAKSAE